MRSGYAYIVNVALRRLGLLVYTWSDSARTEKWNTYNLSITEQDVRSSDYSERLNAFLGRDD